MLFIVFSFCKQINKSLRVERECQKKMWEILLGRAFWVVYKDTHGQWRFVTEVTRKQCLATLLCAYLPKKKRALIQSSIILQRATKINNFCSIFIGSLLSFFSGLVWILDLSECNNNFLHRKKNSDDLNCVYATRLKAVRRKTKSTCKNYQAKTKQQSPFFVV